MVLSQNEATLAKVNSIKIGIEKALYIAEKLRNEFIYNMAKLEGNTLSFAEAETVIYGTSVAGKQMSEIHQIEQIRDSWNELIAQIKNNSFSINKYNFCNFNYIVANGENHDALGGFRKNEVAISGTNFLPPLAIELDAQYQELLKKIEKMCPMQAGLTFFMEASRNQFFGDGNKRSSQLMMNGILMSYGYAPFTISPEDEVSYRTELIKFYESHEAYPFYAFLQKQQAKVLTRFRIDSVTKQQIAQQGKTKPAVRTFSGR